MSNINDPISRRRALALGGGLAGGLAVASAPLLGAPGRALATTARGGIDVTGKAGNGHLPVQQIEAIMQTTGMMMNGVLDITLDRDDLHVTGPGGVPFKPSFQESSEFYFQSLGNGRAVMNGDAALLASETNPFMDKLFEGGIVVQAFHQHFVDESPQTWHIHYRAIGDPLQIAQAMIAAIKVTGTPLPQTQPSNPTTPLPTAQLGRILGGDAQVGSDGVVTVSIPRADTIHLGGVAISPYLNIAISVIFEPLGNGQAACAPDFGMIASEINPALGVARQQGLMVDCLYNQETDEFPQLYWAHCLATGNPVDLAHKVSKVLDQMNVKRS